MWNYLFFRAYLEELDPTEMTGLESYVHQCIKTKSIAFVPIKKALMIEGWNKGTKDMNSMFAKLELLQGEIGKTQGALEEEKEESRKMQVTMEKIMGKLDKLLKK